MEDEFVVQCQQLFRGHAKAQSIMHINEIVAEGDPILHLVIPEISRGNKELAAGHQHGTAAGNVVRPLFSRYVGVPKQIELHIVEEKSAGDATEQHPLAAGRDTGLVP